LGIEFEPVVAEQGDCKAPVISWVCGHGVQPGAVRVECAEGAGGSGDRLVAADLTRLAEFGPWDAVIDTSASELPPRVGSPEGRRRCLLGRRKSWSAFPECADDAVSVGDDGLPVIKVPP
jgi:hypothetical protein